MGLVSNLVRSFSGGRGRGTRPTRTTTPRAGGGGGGLGRMLGGVLGRGRRR